MLLALDAKKPWKETIIIKGVCNMKKKQYEDVILGIGRSFENRSSHNAPR
jgi:hypothetical protein